MIDLGKSRYYINYRVEDHKIFVDIYEVCTILVDDVIQDCRDYSVIVEHKCIYGSSKEFTFGYIGLAEDTYTVFDSSGCIEIGFRLFSEFNKIYKKIQSLSDYFGDEVIKSGLNQGISDLLIVFLDNIGISSKNKKERD